jgi:hypothetical protein
VETWSAKNPGWDAYATSKQCNLATVMVFARETPRLRFNALEPGFTPNTGLGRDANAFLRFLANYILPLLAPHIKYWSTPKRAASVATKVLIDASGQTGIYYDEGGHPMLGSALVRDPKFTGRVATETRALLATIPQINAGEMTSFTPAVRHAELESKTHLKRATEKSITSELVRHSPPTNSTGARAPVSQRRRKCVRSHILRMGTSDHVQPHHCYFGILALESLITGDPLVSPAR